MEVEILKEQSSSQEGFSVFVVEDNPVCRAVATALFERLGYRVEFFPNGAEAKTRLNALSRRECANLKAIFSDLNMPVMGGLELLSFVRNSSNLASIPFVITSSCLTLEIYDESIAKGAAAFIHKPLNPQKIQVVYQTLNGS